MPYYCTVPRCTSMAGKAKNVSFHQFPRDEELATLWNQVLKRGKPYTKYSKVCSLHFRPEDYTITSVGKNKGQWRTLRKDAIPSQNLPSDTPEYSARRASGSWTPAPSSGSARTPGSAGSPGSAGDSRIQQHVAQAIYMQTMLAMQTASNGPGSTHAHLSKRDLTLPHTSKIPIPELEQIMNHRQLDSMPDNRLEFVNHEIRNSYKCEECSKCFKDPDVFVLHRRSHSKNVERLNENISVAYEKENFNANSHLAKQETLKANPILANLLKSGIANASDIATTNIFDTNNILSIENQIMTALAANMESYIRNLSSLLSQNANKDSKSDDLALVDTQNENNESGGENDEMEHQNDDMEQQNDEMEHRNDELHSDDDDEKPSVVIKDENCNQNDEITTREVELDKNNKIHVMNDISCDHNDETQDDNDEHYDHDDETTKQNDIDNDNNVEKPNIVKLENDVGNYLDGDSNKTINDKRYESENDDEESGVDQKSNEENDDDDQIHVENGPNDYGMYIEQRPPKMYIENEDNMEGRESFMPMPFEVEDRLTDRKAEEIIIKEPQCDKQDFNNSKDSNNLVIDEYA